MTDGHPVVKAVVDQLLTVLRAVVMLGALEICFLKQAQDPMRLMLRVREVSKM